VNNKILIGVNGLVVIVGIFLLFNGTENELKNPLKEEVLKKYNKIEKKTNKNINEKKEMKKKCISTQNDKNENKIIKSANSNGNLTQSYDKENNEYFISEKEFDNFVDENNLNEIQSIDDDIKIFAKNLPIKNDEVVPPTPPVLIKVKFKEKTEIVYLNSNLVNANKKIYVAKKNENNKKVEVKEIDTKDLSSFVPPVIGQN
jgi:hypothetical protein